jgi:hypothetical protein
MCTLGRHAELFLWKLLRNASLGTHRELQMRGWKKKEVTKDLAHFQFVSLTTCERTRFWWTPENSWWLYSRKLGQAPGEVHKPVVSWPHGERRWWQLQQTYMAWEPRGQALAPPEKPVAFSSRVKMEAWSTPGEVTSQGEACKLSTRPTLIRTRLPGICADLAGVGVRSRMGLPHTTTSYAGLLAQGRGYKCPLELPGWQAALEMKIQSRLWGPMPGSTLGDCLAFSSK